MPADETQKQTTEKRASIFGPLELVCIVLCLIWLALGVYGAIVLGALADTAQPLERIMALIAIVFPVAVIAMVGAAARHHRNLRQEATALRTSVAQLQHSMDVDARARRANTNPNVQEKLDEIAKSTQQTETALATFVSSRSSGRARAKVSTDAAPPVEAKPKLDVSEAQTSIDFSEETPPATDPIPAETLITALHFPSDADDKEGFAALRTALADRRYRPLVYSGQDVLTRLAKDQIFMDTLAVDRTRPEVWRKFAEGERGPLVSSVGGIRDRQPLALAARALKTEPAFRDTAHQFVQKFDALLTDVAPTMDDETLTKFTQTRSAKAFMVLGRVLGMFS